MCWTTGPTSSSVSGFSLYFQFGIGRKIWSGLETLNNDQRKPTMNIKMKWSVHFQKYLVSKWIKSELKKNTKDKKNYTCMCTWHSWTYKLFFTESSVTDELVTGEHFCIKFSKLILCCFCHVWFITRELSNKYLGLWNTPRAFLFLQKL